MESNVLQDGFGVDVMLPLSTLNQYDNMEYHNEHRDLFSHVKFSTSNNSSFSTLTSPSVTSTND